MPSFLARFASPDAFKEKQKLNMSVAGPLALEFSRALEQTFSVDAILDDDEENTEVNENKENLTGESQQMDSIESQKLLEEIPEDLIEQLTQTKRAKHTTIYAVSKAQLNDQLVKNLSKRISNVDNNVYQTDLNGYESPLYIVLEGTLDGRTDSHTLSQNLKETKRFLSSAIEAHAKAHDVPVFNTFGAAIRHYVSAK